LREGGDWSRESQAIPFDDRIRWLARKEILLTENLEIFIL